MSLQCLLTWCSKLYQLKDYYELVYRYMKIVVKKCKNRRQQTF